MTISLVNSGAFDDNNDAYGTDVRTELTSIITELNTHTNAASPHTNHLITTGDTMTGTLTLDIDSDAVGITMDGEQTTTNGMTLQLDALTSGTGLYIASDSASTTSRSLISVVNDNTASTGTVVLRLQQDSTGDIVKMFDGASEVVSFEQNGFANFVGAVSAYIDKGNSGSGTVTCDATTGNTFKITATGSFTLAISNPADGQKLTFIIVQDATGSRTVTWPTTFRWLNGTGATNSTTDAPTLTTTASKLDIISGIYDSSLGLYLMGVSGFTGAIT